MLEILRTDLEKTIFVDGCLSSRVILYTRKYSVYLFPNFGITPLPYKIPACTRHNHKKRKDLVLPDYFNAPKLLSFSLAVRDINKYLELIKHMRFCLYPLIKGTVN